MISPQAFKWTIQFTVQGYVIYDAVEAHSCIDTSSVFINCSLVSS